MRTNGAKIKREVYFLVYTVHICYFKALQNTQVSGGKLNILEYKPS